MARGRARDVIELSDSDSDSAAASRATRQRRASRDRVQLSEDSEDSDFESRRPKSKRKAVATSTRGSPPVKGKNKQQPKTKKKASVPKRRRQRSNEYSSDEQAADDALSQRMARRAPTPLFSEQVSLSELQAQEREFKRLQRLSQKVLRTAPVAVRSPSKSASKASPRPAAKPVTRQPLLATTLARKQNREMVAIRGTKRRLEGMQETTDDDEEDDEGEEDEEGDHDKSEEEEEEGSASDDFEEDIVEAKKKALRASLALASRTKNKPELQSPAKPSSPMTTRQSPVKAKASTPNKTSTHTPTKTKTQTPEKPAPSKTKIASRVCKKSALAPPPRSPSPPRRRSSEAKTSSPSANTRSSKDSVVAQKTKKKKAKVAEELRRRDRNASLQKEIASLALAEPPLMARRASGRTILSDAFSVSELQAQERAWAQFKVDHKAHPTSVVTPVKEPVKKKVQSQPQPQPSRREKSSTRASRSSTATTSRQRAESVSSDSTMSLVEIVELIEDDDETTDDDNQQGAKSDKDDDFVPAATSMRSNGKSARSKPKKSKAPAQKPANKQAAPFIPVYSGVSSENLSNGAHRSKSYELLAKPRTAAETVPHGTTWRSLIVDVAPPNLLTLTTLPTQPFESTADLPLVEYDPTGELDAKCQLLASFGKNKSFLLTNEVAESGLSQDAMNLRVMELLETWTPQIKGCYERKSDAVVREARGKTSEYLRLRDEQLQSIIQRAANRDDSLKYKQIAVCPAERTIAKQLLVPKTISPLDVMDKVIVGRGETFLVEKELVAHTAVQLAPLRGISRSTTYTGIKTSVRVEDDPIMRYVPYFGDNDSGDVIDLKQYDGVRAKDATDGVKTSSALDNETHEYMLRLVVAELGDSETVFNALKQVAGFAQPHTEYVEIKKMRDARRNASKRMAEIRAYIASQGDEGEEDQDDDAPTRHALKQLTEALYPFIAPTRSAEGRVPLLERFASHWTYFETNLLPAASSRERPATTKFRRLLGLRHTNDYADLSETYRDLFCRMCYKYDCPDHGIEHPLPTRRADPVYPTTKYEPVKKDSADNNAEDEEAPSESKPSELVAIEVAETEEETNSADEATPSAAATVDVTDLASECSVSTVDAESQDVLDSSPARRRSSRSGTRASTLATISVESQLIALGHKPRAPRVRAKPAPKRTKVDESEYVDDSHWPLVSEKVKTYVDPTESCSESCWKASKKEQEAKGEEEESKSSPSGDDAFTEPDEAIKARLNAAELLLLQKLRYTLGDNACMIAAVLHSLPCRDVHTYLLSQQRSKPIDQQGYFSPEVSGKKNRKRGRSTAALPGNNRELLKRTRNQRLKDTSTANHDYEPCNHDGICDFSGGCSCMKRDHMCEKACSCSRDCPNRFQGCRCSMGNCRTNACPCFVAMRECNPDLCITCGATDVPVLVHHEQLQQLSSLDLGICCNVNVQRALHKKIGVSFSRTHGWGAFALEPIRRGEFIYEYTGAVVSHDEAERRGTIYDKLNISFLFDLNEDSVLDAIRTGNKSKFCNHANVGQKCMARIMRVGGEHRISIWASHDIAKGEELFFNYGYHGESAPVWSQGARITEASKREAAAEDAAALQADDAEDAARKATRER